ncbi:lycopene cyclase domain-containing protein [Chryseolinea serpens]|uniref:Lycopene cyclase domain-containing protein n=2 Tax=Chryseolinea serpens TaxID=947013 RepID=A0A1M5XU92_9BACT|nr:lycopene cyclase domain-containing protein [Chryseolinea serpens]
MLNSKYLYLTIDFLTILFPVLFSFYSKANFSKKWRNLWVAILIPGTIFILWDEWFTQKGVWGFNEKYLSGVYLGSLPIEEILFFICIPYASLFIYVASNYLVKKDYLGSSQKAISSTIVLVCLVIGFLNTDRWYTSTALLGLAAYLFTLQFIWKVNFLGRFYFSYFLTLIPFFIVNGILTGTWIEEPVVWYNNAENLGIRIGTIPAEDALYGMFLIAMSVSILEWLQCNITKSLGTSAIQHLKT